MKYWWVVGLVIPFAVGCSADEARYAEEPVQAEGSFASPASPVPSEPAPVNPSPADAGKDEKTGTADGNTASTDAAPAARKVHYDGAASLEARTPEAVVDAVAASVAKAGGWIQARTPTSLVAKVPVDGFMALWSETLKRGKVLDKQLTSIDVTEAYADAELRQRLLAATLERLEVLLRDAKSAAERLALLGQIGALRERLEQLEAQLATLRQLADYSTLTVDVKAPQPVTAGMQAVPIGAFAWIGRLSPDAATVAYGGKKTTRKAPAGFVEIKDRGYWTAESATAAQLRATRLANDPHGDAAFWASALKRRLGERFTVAEVVANGTFTVVRCQEEGVDKGYRYDVAVSVDSDGDSLTLFEAFYPTVEDEKRLSAAVLASLLQEKEG